MGKWMKRRAGFSGFMAVAMLAGSFSAGAAVPEQMTAYEGALICGQKEHTHDQSCFEQASASDAKKADSEMVCGLNEHVHDGSCYEGGKNVTGLPMPEKALPDQTPGPERAEMTEKDQEETVDLMPAALERSGDAFQVHTFAELYAAVEEAKKEEDGEDCRIVLQNDIEWDGEIEAWSDTPILLDMNGHSIRILKEKVLWVGGSFTIQGSGKETITLASSIEMANPYSSHIIAGWGALVLDNVKIVAEDSQKELPPLIRSEGSCTLNDVTIEDYLVHGSLIYAESSYGVTDPPTALTIQGGLFSGIRSDRHGAVVCAVGEKEDDQQYYFPGKIVIHDATFKNNRAAGDVAVCIASENGLEITGSVFENNQATDDDGGAVGVYGGFSEGAVNIDGCVFTNNHAAGNGGAICCGTNINLFIANGTFEGNKASDGGAVAISDAISDAHICKTKFTDNHAENNGGAIHADSKVYMEEVTLQNNKAENRGGAVYMEENLSEDGTSRSALVLYDAVITGNHAPENGHAVECTYSLQMEGERCPAIFGNESVDGDSIFLHPSAKAGTVYGTMLGGGDAGLEIIYESGADKQTLHKGENAEIDPSSDGAIRLAFQPSGIKGILDLSPLVLMDGNVGGVAGSAIYGTSLTFITSEKNVPEEPEKPDPENPDPEKPDPENPDPENPDPEKPGPENPDPEKPEPENPKPENPEPEKPDPEKPKPENPGTGSSSSRGSRSVSSSIRSTSSQGMSIAKPYYIQLAASGREMSDTRPGWKLRKPDGSYAASEWVLETDGSWYLYGEDGYTCYGWQKVNGEWYFFDETAQNMKTDWIIREGKWYYLDTVNGSMKTGWVQLDSKWYFLSPDGALVTNGYTPDGYYVDDNGEWK